MFDFKGSVVLVTGGNGGIGKGIALGFAQSGAAVAIVARNEAKTAAAVAELQALGARAIGLTCDVQNREEILQAVAAVQEQLGPVDILVNNAGWARPERPEEITEEAYDAMLDTNLKGPFLFSQAVYPGMKAKGSGVIINIASVAGLIGQGTHPTYAASKAGLISLTKSLALAWGKEGIRVNGILPGWISTEMLAQIARDPEWMERAIKRVPLSRIGEPADIANTVLFLCSDLGNYITGQSIVIDGGLMA